MIKDLEYECELGIPDIFWEGVNFINFEVYSNPEGGYRIFLTSVKESNGVLVCPKRFLEEIAKKIVRKLLKKYKDFKGVLTGAIRPNGIFFHEPYLISTGSLCSYIKFDIYIMHEHLNIPTIVEFLDKFVEYKIRLLKTDKRHLMDSYYDDNIKDFLLDMGIPEVVFHYFNVATFTFYSEISELNEPSEIRCHVAFSNPQNGPITPLPKIFREKLRDLFVSYIETHEEETNGFNNFMLFNDGNVFGIKSELHSINA